MQSGTVSIVNASVFVRRRGLRVGVLQSQEAHHGLTDFRPRRADLGQGRAVGRLAQEEVLQERDAHRGRPRVVRGGCQAASSAAPALRATTRGRLPSAGQWRSSARPGPLVSPRCARARGAPQDFPCARRAARERAGPPHRSPRRPAARCPARARTRPPDPGDPTPAPAASDGSPQRDSRAGFPRVPGAAGSPCSPARALRLEPVAARLAPDPAGAAGAVRGWPTRQVPAARARPRGRTSAAPAPPGSSAWRTGLCRTPSPPRGTPPARPAVPAPMGASTLRSRRSTGTPAGIVVWTSRDQSLITNGPRPV